MEPQRPVFVLRLRPLPRVDGIRALRRGLKYLLRGCGLQCLDIKTEPQTEKSNAKDVETSTRRTATTGRSRSRAKTHTGRRPGQGDDAGNAG